MERNEKLESSFWSRMRRLIAGTACVVAAIVIAGCGKVEEEVSHIYGMESYVYGFPLVMMDVTRDKLTAASKSEQLKAPINQFARIREYVTPAVKDVVRISVNSLWSHGFVDLQEEPIIISWPDTRGRYIVVQGLNMWTDNFISLGTRTNGGKGGNFMIVGPSWKGTAPSDVQETYRSSTRYAWILVQIAAGSPKDFPEVHALQDQLNMTPLSAWGKPYTPPSDVPVNPDVDLTMTPYDHVRLMTGEMFFNRLAMALKDNPPYPADTTAVERLKKIGVEAGKKFGASKLEPATLKGINEAPGNVWLKFAQGPYEKKGVNGWLQMPDVGKYGTDYDTRALIAWLGLGALASEDCIYPSAFVDGDGEVLDGAKKYVIRFEKGQLPPSAAGVWSISPYRENFYVPNAIGRYGILSSMPLKYNADGSLEVYLQATSPGPDKESNWLPIPPSDPFNLTIRIYQPKKEAIDGTYKLPPARRVQ